MATAYLSLGSNMGDPVQNIERALELLETRDVHVSRRSSMYHTEPRDYLLQPWFVNLVAQVETTLPPRGLLQHVQKVEQILGRTREVDKGPRTLDIDIIFFGSMSIDCDHLQIPHPRMLERRFVLEPLAEIAPDLIHPAAHKTIRELLANVEGQKVLPLNLRP